jgi:hypothetical protein
MLFDHKKKKNNQVVSIKDNICVKHLNILALLTPGTDICKASYIGSIILLMSGNILKDLKLGFIILATEILLGISLLNFD